MFSRLGGMKGLFAGLFFLLFTSVSAVDINNMPLIAEYQLADDGYSADIALHPTDGSLHVAWVNRFGDIKYAVRNFNGAWSNPSTVPDGGVDVYANEENIHDRKCMGMCIDYHGVTHMVFSDSGGDLYYVYGVPGMWSAPVRLVSKAPNTIYPDIVAVRSLLYVVYEDANADKIYGLYRIGGTWTGPQYMCTGEYPSLATGSDDRVYFLCRGGLYEAGDFHRSKFAVLTAGQTSWQFKTNMTNPAGRTGQGPGMAVANGKVYISWSMGIDDPDINIKTQLFTAAASEPGNSWTPRMGEATIGPYDIPYYENTGDPHSRVTVFSDGLVMQMNGGRNERFRIWQNNTWSKLRAAPWNDSDNWGGKGILQVVNDGRTAWVTISSSGSSLGKVSVCGITHPGGQVLNPPPPDAVDDLQIVTKQVLTSAGYSGDVAVDPATGRVNAVWVQNSGIKHAYRALTGNWSTATDISSGGLTVHGEEGGWPRPCLAVDIGNDGKMHLVFSSGGNLYYIHNKTGSWSTPLKIANHDGSLIYPDISVWQNTISVVYQDMPEREIYTVESRNGVWLAPALLSEGENPVFSSGRDGLLYACWRGMGSHRDLDFASRVPTFTGWKKQTSFIVPENETGASPGMTVWNDQIYVAWSNDTGVEFSDFKSQLNCTIGDEPGTNWTPAKGSYGPVYTENTGDPHSRISAYSDGQILLLNGRRLESRFALYNGEIWSRTRTGPWKDGYPAVTTDGQIVWVIVGSNGSASDEVSVTGIRKPDAEPFDFVNPAPQITFDIDTLEAEVGQTLTYSAGLNDASGSALTMSISSVTPALTGMSFDGASNMVRWTPQASQLTADLWGRGPGRHLFGITLTNEAGKSETVYFWIRVVNANNAPQITSTPVTQVNAGEMYQYTVTATDIDGDALTFSLEEAPAGMVIGAQSGIISWAPIAANKGNHNVRAAVTDARGDVTSQSFTVTVIDNTIPPPVALFNADHTEGIRPLTVQFTSESTGNITAYAWDFGDFQTGSEQNPLHVYQNAGSFTVRLIVSGPGGSDTLTVQNCIQSVEPPPDALFSADPDSGSAPLVVQFADLSSGSATAWHWDFGDGNQSTDRHPAHTFQNAGWFAVQLTVTGPGGIDSLTIENMIQVGIPKPIAGFSADTTWGYNALTVQFTDQSLGAVTAWSWDFGDGSVSAEQNPQHIYSGTGAYSVKLRVQGPGGADSLSVESMIHVLIPGPIAIFSADTTWGEAPLSVQFSDWSQGDIQSRQWEFGDGGTSDEINPVYTYSEAGDFTVRLIIEGPGGRDTLTVNDMIHVEPVTGIVSETAVPQTFSLYPNTPNPFNPSTHIRFDLPETRQIRVAVYDLRGQRVTVLKEGAFPAGRYDVIWNGLDAYGRAVPTGMYVIMLEAGRYRAQRKAIFMK